jgi:hypothetical protein
VHDPEYPRVRRETSVKCSEVHLFIYESLAEAVLRRAHSPDGKKWSSPGQSRPRKASPDQETSDVVRRRHKPTRPESTHKSQSTFSEAAIQRYKLTDAQCPIAQIRAERVLLVAREPLHHLHSVNTPARRGVPRARAHLREANPACPGGFGRQRVPGAVGWGTSVPSSILLARTRRRSHVRGSPTGARRHPVFSAAVPSTPCGIAPFRRSSKLGWRSRPRPTRRHRRPTSSKRFAAISNAASSVVVLPGPFARRAGTPSWLLFRVAAGPYAHLATPDAWWRRPRIWSITCCRRCRCASGSLPYPIDCAVFCTTMRRCKARSQSWLQRRESTATAITVR